MSTDGTDAAQGSQDSAAREEIARFKEYLADPKAKIRLDDMVQESVRATVKVLTGEEFPVNTSVRDGKTFMHWLKRYEEAIKPLQAKAVLLSRWATPAQVPTLNGLLARLSDVCAANNQGNTLWLAMRWYPISVLVYSAGITAVSVDNYAMLGAVLNTRSAVVSRRRAQSGNAIVLPITEGMLEIVQSDAWKCTDEYRNTRVAESEHMFRTLRPVLDDILYLGTSFERHFDRFEILRTLTYVDLSGDSWGPVGRFAFTGHRGISSPFQEIKEDAAKQKDRWPPIAGGMFGGSYTRFEAAAKGFEEAILSKTGW